VAGIVCGFVLLHEVPYMLRPIATISLALYLFVTTLVAEAITPPAGSGCESSRNPIVEAQILRLGHVVVWYDGIGRAYAEAIARVINRARAAAIDQFGFDMPETIDVSVSVTPAAKVPAVWTNGRDQVHLVLRNTGDLRKPKITGFFAIYGMCHEVGHIGMNRLTRCPPWVTFGAGEGWAHYFGSRVVEIVWATEKAELWPDRYKYVEDGMTRFEGCAELISENEAVRCSFAWKALAEMVGDKDVAPIFRAIGQTKLSSADPAAEIERASPVLAKNERTKKWWNDNKALLVRNQAESRIAAERVEESKLAGKPIELALDDGQSAGMSTLPGGGHVVRFQAPDGTHCLTGIRIYGSRYGDPNPPKEDFRVMLFDKSKRIADFSHPYAKFPYGNPRWVDLNIKPTPVPREFAISVKFDPTSRKGVFVHYDKEGSGNSQIALDCGVVEQHKKGDWMIRCTLDRQAK
jgi:hypothetical protein